jgi:hypothetical protein
MLRYANGYDKVYLLALLLSRPGFLDRRKTAFTKDIYLRYRRLALFVKYFE